MNSIKIRKATFSDSQKIYELSVQNILFDYDEDRNEGFLVSSYSKEQYEELISNVDFFYVAEKNGAVIAFILAFFDNTILDDVLNNLIEKYVGRKFVLIKQICVDKLFVKQGIGNKLYKFLLDYTDHTPILAAIVLKPENTVSINFHEKLGFRQLFEFIPIDGMLRGMWGIRV